MPAARQAKRTGAVPRPAEDTAPPEIREAAWIGAAREALIEGGLGAVKVDRLAKRLGVTRGGFYWRFANPAALLDALLEDWRETNSAAFLAALAGPGTPRQRFDALMRVCIEEDGYSPAYDTAIREWGRVDPKVAQAVAEVDETRIAALERLFAEGGYRPREALVRARVTYYHQVGYDAMGVQEARERRWTLSATYRHVLTGWD